MRRTEVSFRSGVEGRGATICPEHASGVSGGVAVRCLSAVGSREESSGRVEKIVKKARVQANRRRRAASGLRESPPRSSQRSRALSSSHVAHAASGEGRAGKQGRTSGVGDDRDQGISSRFVGLLGWRARSGPWSLEGAPPRVVDSASASVEMSRGAGPRSISLSTSTPTEEASTRAASPCPSRSSAAVLLRVSMSTRPSAGVAAVAIPEPRHVPAATR